MSEHKYGNAGAIGFIGFGLATSLLSLAYIGVFPDNTAPMLGMIIFIGGFVEIVAGAMLWKMGDSFASLAFTAFGFFWLTLATVYLAPSLGIYDVAGVYVGPTGKAMACYLALWGIFAGGMAIGAAKAPKAVTLLLAMLSILFFLLAIVNGVTESWSADLLKFAGVWGLINGLVGIYITLAMVINETFGKEVLPLFAPKAASA